MSNKAVVNIRMPRFLRLVLESYTADLQLRRDQRIYTSDALLALLEQGAPEHIEKVRQIHPDLWKEMNEDK